MKLLQFTDIHLTDPGSTIGGRDPNANFDRALEHAVSLHGDAEALFITGDLSDWGEAEDYSRLRARLQTVPLPVHLCIGNHDDRDAFLSVFPERADANGFVQSVVPLSLGHAVTLDTFEPETHAGHFCDNRAGWLTAQLEQLPGPVWIFMHHNPVPAHIAPLDQIMLVDADRFEAAIAPHRHKIRHIFHGHCHFPLAGSLGGIPFSAPRGTNHAGWPDYSKEPVLGSCDLPQAYAVVFGTPEHTLVTMIEFGYAGEIRVEGLPDYATWDKETMVR